MIYDLKELNLSIEEVLLNVKPFDTIYLDDITYNEKLDISINNLTIKGRSNSKISYSVKHSDINPKTNQKYGTTGSAILRILESANNFTLIDVTVENSYVRSGDKSEQAVAFKSEASNTTITNCKFISCQDTFYIDFGKNNKVINSYIEGDVDFVFGSADCLFKDCTIYAKNTNKGKYYIAPNTYKTNQIGLVFENTKFICDDTSNLYLGRRWYPSNHINDVLPRATFINCILPDIEPSLITMHETDPKDDVINIINSKFNNKLVNIINDKDILEKVKTFND